jgi:hypothetical protein
LSALTCGPFDLSKITRNPPPASSAPGTVHLASLEGLPETLERLRTLLEQIVSPRPPQGILTDYLTPAELAADLHIKEDRLSEWKREGFGPPRTRIMQRVVYRREAVLAWLRTLEEEGGAADLSPRSRMMVQRARPPPAGG